jgi:GMP synthase-like glutamine amidotransferase
MRRVLVFQHMDADNLGRLDTILREDDVAIDMVKFQRGQTIPSLEPYDALIVLGGSMDVWEEDAHPWLKDEKQAIREWVNQRHRPYLGICLGHQLLADALGGKVGMAQTQELGVYDVARTDTEHRLFDGVPQSMEVFEWHHCEVQRLPQGGVNLASSNNSAVQAMAVGENALGLQFHVEFDMQSIHSWADNSAYLTAMERALGAGAYPRLREQAAPIMKNYDALARRIWANLKKPLIPA